MAGRHSGAQREGFEAGDRVSLTWRRRCESVYREAGLLGASLVCHPGGRAFCLGVCEPTARGYTFCPSPWLLASRMSIGGVITFHSLFREMIYCQIWGISIIEDILWLKLLYDQ